jgi:hypothetical protein
MFGTFVCINNDRFVLIDQVREYDDLKNLTVAQATLATPWIRPCIQIKWFTVYMWAGDFV